MLNLRRKLNEKIVIVIDGEKVLEFWPYEMQGESIRFAFEADRSVNILRKEVYEKNVSPKLHNN